MDLSMWSLCIYVSSTCYIMRSKLGNNKKLVAIAHGRARGLENPVVKLEDWHPTTGGNMDSTYDPDLGRVYPAWPKHPAFIGCITIRIQQRTLS
jgi:hypothetical protein